MASVVREGEGPCAVKSGGYRQERGYGILTNATPANEGRGNDQACTKLDEGRRNRDERRAVHAGSLGCRAPPLQRDNPRTAPPHCDRATATGLRFFSERW